MTSIFVSSGKDSSFLYSPSKVQQYFETRKKIGESFRKSYQEVLGEAGITYWLSSELKFKVALLHVAQLLQLLSLMSLQPLYPFCQLGRRALYNYCFIYMYHKPIVLYIGAKLSGSFLSSHHRISFEIYTTPEAVSILLLSIQ